MNLRTIVAPTDLEDASMAGLQAAAGLARSAGAKLVVLHVMSLQDVDVTEPHHEPLPLRTELLERAEAGLSRQISQLTDGIDIETRVTFGDLLTEVTDLADEKEADLVVITVKNRSRLGKLLMGSHAQDIILSARRPVLTVPRV